MMESDALSGTGGTGFTGRVPSEGLDRVTCVLHGMVMLCTAMGFVISVGPRVGEDPPPPGHPGIAWVSTPQRSCSSEGRGALGARSTKSRAR